MKKLSFLAMLLLATGVAFGQGVGINTATPHNSAMLDVVSTNKGVLIPRMTAAQRGAITLPAAGLLVYQTDAPAGFWYYDGAIWRQLTTGGWLLTGNAGTNASTNFVGTTDAQALTFRTDNVERFRIANGNQVFAMADGTAAAPFYSWSANTNMGLFRPAANVLGFSTSGTERMRMSNTELVINGQSNVYNFRVESDNRTHGLFVDAANDVVRFGSDNTASLYADNTVVTGITVDYVADFDKNTASGTAIGVGSVEYLLDALSETRIAQNFAPAGDNLYDCGTFTYSWREVNAWTVWTYSDMNSKKDVEDIQYGLKEIMQLRPVAYKWKNNSLPNGFSIPLDKQKTSLGFLAQEVAPVLKELVRNESWEPVDEKGNYQLVQHDKYQMNYFGLIPVIVKAIQEQQKQIETLKKENDFLKKQINELKQIQMDIEYLKKELKKN